MAERAKVTEKSLPRRLEGCSALASGAMAALLAATGAVHAQSPVPDLYSPTLTIDTGNPPSFGQGNASGPTATRRFQQVLRTGNAPPSGAGETGFVSQSAPPAQQNGALAPSAVAPSTLEPSAPLASAEPIDDLATPSRARPRRRRAESEDPYEPLGLRLGSFIVKPAIELSGGYDTNPELSSPARGGSVLTVAPELQVRSDWSRHEFRADVRGSYTTHPGFKATPSLDRPFLDSKVASRIDVTRRTRIDLEGRFSLSTENPNSPNLPANLAELPITTTTGFTAGVARRFNRFELGVSGSLSRTVYDKSKLTDGTFVNNDDRNYEQYGVQLRGSYELVPGVKPFVQVNADRRVYDLSVDAGGVNRDSDGNEARIGTTFELTGRLVGSGSIGYAERRYRDPSLRSIDGLVADGSLTWTATPLTKVTFTAQSRIGETTLTDVSGVLTRDFGVQIDHSFRRWLIGTLRFGYGIDDYVGSARVDERYMLAGIVTYKLSRNAQLKGEVRRNWLNSNVAGASYVDDIFLLGLRLQQ
jgi:hypothetical protein